MIRRPPRSTLFPYPPLSRSHGLEVRRLLAVPSAHLGAPPAGDERVRGHAGAADPDQPQAPPLKLLQARSEIGRAHVELQSRSDLVCRLLLEKKKITQDDKAS